MKRKLFIMVVAVLVICLTAGVLLTACKPKQGEETDPNEGGGAGNVYTTKKALGEVISNIYDGTYKGVIFDGTAATEGGEETTLGIDAELDFVIGTDTYTLIAKGNLDIRPSITSNAAEDAIQDNSELYIGIKQNAKTLFGIGYDVEKGADGLAPYLYLVSTDENGANPVIRKVYGLSIAQMMYDSKNQATATTSMTTDEIMDFVNLVPTLLGETLFGASCQRNSFGAGGTQYIFNFNLKNTVTSLSSGIVALLDSLKELFDLTPYIGPVVDGLKELLPEEYKDQVSGTGTTGLQQLLNVFAGILGKNEENNVTGTFTFNFNADKSFNSASIAIDASKFVDYLNKDNETTDENAFDGKFTINIDKLVLTNDEKIDAFAGTPLENKVAGENVYDVQNMLDFDFEAIAVGDDDKYTIEMDMDINPFVLTEMMAVTDKVGGKVTDEGKAFWAAKMAESLAKAGTATLIVKKTAGDPIESGFDASKVDGMTADEAKTVIAYAKVDDFGVDVFVWDPIHGNEVSFGSDITFPMSWTDVVAGITKKDSAGTSADDITATIGKVFDYAGPILGILGPFFDAISVDGSSLTMQYTDIINNALKPILAAFVNDFTWVDANLYQLLAGIFGTYTPAGDGVEEVIDYADEVTFTLVSFNYGDPAIYPAA